MKKNASTHMLLQMEQRLHVRLDEHDKHFMSINQKLLIVDERCTSIDDVLSRIVTNMATKDVLEDLDERVARVEITKHEAQAALDTFAARSDKYELEHGSFLVQTRRYQKWFGQLSRATGVKLEA
jgi:hypothetical protein